MRGLVEVRMAVQVIVLALGLLAFLSGILFV